MAAKEICTTQSKALVYLFIMLVSSFYSGALHKQRRLDYFNHLPLLTVLFPYQFSLCSKSYSKVLPPFLPLEMGAQKDNVVYEWPLFLLDVDQ